MKYNLLLFIFVLIIIFLIGENHELIKTLLFLPVVTTSITMGKFHGLFVAATGSMFFLYFHYAIEVENNPIYVKIVFISVLFLTAIIIDALMKSNNYIVDENSSSSDKVDVHRISRMEKMESIGLLAGGIAHDFGNLITIALSNISLTKEKLRVQDKSNGFDNDNLINLLEDAENSLQKSKDLTQQLLTYSRGGSPILKATSIQEVLKDACKLALASSSVEFKFDIQPDLMPVKADEGQIFQVLHNIILNACQAVPDGGTVKIKAENIIINGDEHLIPLEPGNYVKISIEDDGIGIPEENKEKIFDPYFTTKPEGSGLGLATCYSIINKHGGHITVDSETDKGTVFTIYLQAADESKSNIPKSINSDENKRILVMDDEKMLRAIVKEALESFGYHVVCAKDGDEAINIVKNSNSPFDIALLDLTIPTGKGGKETVKELKELDPELKAFIMSGFTDNKTIFNYDDYGFEGIVTKPFSIEELKDTISKV